MTTFIKRVFPTTVCAVQTTRIWGEDDDFDAHSLQQGGFQTTTFIDQFDIPRGIHWLKQKHGSTVVDADLLTSAVEADACYTSTPGVVCAVITADCLPVLIADRQATWVAAVHCGWRGLFQNILVETIAKFGGDTSDLVVWLGPCIQRQAYEVDVPFLQQFIEAHPQMTDAFDPVVNGKSQADLPLIAKKQLVNLGVQHIYQSSDCTFSMADQYHSWRRDKCSKRMASLIWFL